MVTPSARREELRYVRFEHASEVISGVRYGPFSYVSDARQILSGDDLEALEALVAWFEEHLDAPASMVPFRDVGERRARRRAREAMGQCWFREDATAHILRARQLVTLLERADIVFVERWSRRLPGKLCSEDGVQVVVVPYRDTGADEER